MGFIAKNSGGGDYKRVPTGLHLARCYSIIDLGTQTSTGQHGTKSQRKIQLGWEVLGNDEHDQPMTIEVGGQAMPLTIRKSYTLSLHEKAGLRKDLSGWRGRDFTDEEVAGFDVSKLMGVYCMLNVTESKRDDKTYANVASISKLHSSLKNNLPAPVHSNVLFDIDAPDKDLFNRFHESLQKAIMSAPEWTSKRVAAQSEGPANLDISDDDIPF